MPVAKKRQQIELLWRKRNPFSNIPARIESGRKDLLTVSFGVVGDLQCRSVWRWHLEINPDFGTLSLWNTKSFGSSHLALTIQGPALRRRNPIIGRRLTNQHHSKTRGEVGRQFLRRQVLEIPNHSGWLRLRPWKREICKR